MPAEDEDWLRRFHHGEPEVLAQCYRLHFDTVARAVGALLTGVDRETAIHDVFYRLVSSADARASFRGGSLAAWLTVIARRQALDVLRAQHRERSATAAWSAASAAEEEAGAPTVEVLERRLEARRLVHRFRREHLPAKWTAVFDALFLRGLSQREAAAELNLSRTTIAYQDLRIRHLLKKYLLTPETP